MCVLLWWWYEAAMGWDEAQDGSRRLGRSLDQLGHSGSGTLPLGPPTLLTHIQWQWSSLTHRCFPLHYFLYFCCPVFLQMLCVSIIVIVSTSTVVMLCLRVVDILTLIVYVCRLIKQFIGSWYDSSPTDHCGRLKPLQILSGKWTSVWFSEQQPWYIFVQDEHIWEDNMKCSQW